MIDRRSVSRWQVAMRRAMLVMAVLYTLFGVFGYIARERRGLRIDNFNFFETVEGEHREIFDPIR